MLLVGEDGNELPPGSEHLGEIVLRGHTVMKSYYNDSESHRRGIPQRLVVHRRSRYRDADGDLFVAVAKTTSPAATATASSPHERPMP